ncbi:hypothetical protein ACOMHN_008742 [Nucella lapillus]
MPAKDEEASPAEQTATGSGSPDNSNIAKKPTRKREPGCARKPHARTHRGKMAGAELLEKPGCRKWGKLMKREGFLP